MKSPTVFCAAFLMLVGTGYGQTVATGSGALNPVEQESKAAKEIKAQPQQVEPASANASVTRSLAPAYYTAIKDDNGEGNSDTKTTDVLLTVFTAMLVMTALGQIIWMQKTINSAEDSTKRQLRAYVSPNDVEIFQQGEMKDGVFCDTFFFRVAFKNTGKSPARKLTAVAVCGKMAYPIPPGIAFAVPEPENRSVSSIGGGEVKRTSAKAITYSEAEIKKIMQGEGTRIYVWGMIKYEDIFGGSQFSKFCKFVQWSEGKAYAYNYKDFNEET